jgi:hypothetical protein
MGVNNPVFTVKVLEPAADSVCGLNVAVLLAGKPLILRPTIPLNPAMGLTLIV